MGCTLKDEDRHTEKQFLNKEQFVEWAHLGFIRAIAATSKITEEFASKSWRETCLELIENADQNELDLPKQVNVKFNYLCQFY